MRRSGGEARPNGQHALEDRLLGAARAEHVAGAHDARVGPRSRGKSASSGDAALGEHERREAGDRLARGPRRRAAASRAVPAELLVREQAHAERVEPRQVEVALVLVELVAPAPAPAVASATACPAAARRSAASSPAHSPPQSATSTGPATDAGSRSRPRPATNANGARGSSRGAYGRAPVATTTRSQPARSSSAALRAEPQLDPGRGEVARRVGAGSAPTARRAPARGRPGGAGRRCRPSRSIRRHAVARRRGLDRGGDAGRPGADDDDVPRRAAGARPRQRALAAGAQVDDAADRHARRGSGRCSAWLQPMQATTSSARPRRGLRDELRVGDQRPRHADERLRRRRRRALGVREIGDTRRGDQRQPADSARAPPAAGSRSRRAARAAAARWRRSRCSSTT